MSTATVSAETRSRIFGPPGRVTRVTVLTPWGIATQVHAELDELFLDACLAAHRVSSWVPQRCDSYNPRPIRGEDGDRLSEWSLHAWCLAHDWFVTPPDVPPPGGVWNPNNPVPVEFAECFTRRGFRWGATFRRVDVPHIEWAAGQPPDRSTPVVVPPSIEELAMPTYSTATCGRPGDPDRFDLVVHDADDGFMWHAWGTKDDADAGGWERLDPRMQILAGSLSAAWNEAAPGAVADRLTVTGVGLDGAVWTLTWVEAHGDVPGRWGDPQQTSGRVA